MAPHAGYAGVALVASSLLQEVIRGYYLDVATPVVIDTAIPVRLSDGSDVVVVPALVIGEPTITVAPSLEPGQVSLAISVVGTVRVDDTGGATLVTPAVIEAHATVTPVLSATLDQSWGLRVAVTPPSGGRLVPKLTTSVGDPLDDILASEAVRDAIDARVSGVLASLTNLIPQISIPMMGFLSATGVKVANQRVELLGLAGRLAILVSLTIATDSGIVALTGARHDVHDFSDGHRVASVGHPSLFGLITPTIRSRLATQLAEQHATLESFDCHLAEGAIHLAGVGDATGASVEFAIRFVPRISGPADGKTVSWDDEYGQSHSYWVPGPPKSVRASVIDLDIDVDFDLWVQLLALALLPAGSYVLLGAVEDLVLSGAMYGVAAFSRQLVPAVATFQLPGVSAVATLDIAAIRCSPVDGVVVHVDGEVVPAGSPLISITAQGSNNATAFPFDTPLVAVVTVPARVARPGDPTIRVRWQLHRAGRPGPFLTQDLPWTDPQAGSFAYVIPSTEAPGGPDDVEPNDDWTIEVRLSRSTPSAGVVEIAAQRHPFTIGDRLDRSYRYVRWHGGPTYVPVWSDGTYEGSGVRYRKSDIHRTSLHGRCRMAASFNPGKARLSYSQDLPFAMDPGSLVANRRVLCDYCFFGGPDKTVPLPLDPPIVP